MTQEEIRLLKEVKNKDEEMAVQVVMEDGGSPGGGKDNDKCGNRDTNNTGSNTSTNSTATTVVANTANDKTVDNGSGGGDGSKRTIRTSGFRICKPQGTFLWPNMGSGACSGISPIMIGGGRAAASGFVGELLSSSHLPGLMGTTTSTITTTLEEHLLAGVPTPPSASSATTSAPKLLLLQPPAGPASPSLPRPAADVLVVPPYSPQQPRQEKTPGSGNPCPSLAYHLHLARGTSSPFAGDEGELRGWSNAITTDLALATPSSSYRPN